MSTSPMFPAGLGAAGADLGTEPRCGSAARASATGRGTAPSVRRASAVTGFVAPRGRCLSWAVRPAESP